MQGHSRVSDLCSFILQGSLDLLASLANELRHNLLVIVPQREVGGDAAVVTAQQAYCSPVISPRRIHLGVIVANRHARLSQCGNLAAELTSRYQAKIAQVLNVACQIGSIG